ncbi:unnamed protein product [Protopolystoma xenopodis]|uniref:Uncharacterized protein n=1 Tax=Protopolystoma xenopodis TaxID=117903 RepID=A0A3S5AFM0_9PLAT|nr:unnamed protein product [Protopolystoma xenopodis]
MHQVHLCQLETGMNMVGTATRSRCENEGHDNCYPFLVAGADLYVNALPAAQISLKIGPLVASPLPRPRRPGLWDRLVRLSPGPREALVPPSSRRLTPADGPSIAESSGQLACRRRRRSICFRRTSSVSVRLVSHRQLFVCAPTSVHPAVPLCRFVGLSVCLYDRLCMCTSVFLHKCLLVCLID